MLGWCRFSALLQDRFSPQCAQEAIWAVQESRQALVSGSSSALAAQQREAEMSEADVKALLDRFIQGPRHHRAKLRAAVVQW